MKKLMPLFALAFAVSTAAVQAAEEKAAEKKPTAQQIKMKSCNKEAGEKGLKGPDRKAFMSGCLKGGSKQS